MGNRDLFNHYLIWLKANDQDFRPKSFRLKKIVGLNISYSKFIKEDWKNFEVSRRGNFVPREKLNNLKSKLKW